MTTTNTKPDAWEAFKQEFGLNNDAAPAPHASLAPLRAEVERLGAGRPRKQPPVAVMDDERYCWGCFSVLPRASFNIDRWRSDGLRMKCRKCDGDARARRQRERRARLKSQPANGGA